MRYGDAPHTEGDGIRALVDAVDRLRDEISQRHTENTSTLEVMEDKVNVLIDRVDDIARGFPNDDPDGHRRAHEALIKKAEERAALYRAVREELIKKGVWAMVLMLAGLLGSALLLFIRAKVTS